MAPKKAQTPRRSARIANSSRNSSPGLELETASVLGAVKSKITKRATNAPAVPFSVEKAIERILGDNRAFINRLTLSEANAVIAGMADRIHSQDDKISQLTAERDDARARLAEKRALRDSIFRTRFHETRLSDAASASLSSSSSSVFSSTTPAHGTSTPTVNPQSPVTITATSATENSGTDMDLTEHNPLAITPAPARLRTTFFGSLLKNFASPFSAAFKNAATTPKQQASSERLGELPASRKRSAPALESTRPEKSEPVATTPILPRQSSVHAPSLRASSTDRAARTLTAPSSRNPLADTSLTTITEASEQNMDIAPTPAVTKSSEQKITIAPTPTPSRAPRSVTQMRRMRNKATPVITTPSRAWNRPAPPREPNADTRMQKLRNFYKAKEQFETMGEDPEVKEMTAERPMKRVKVDKLVVIPHNRPGDAEGTFRYPDIDSDSEIEVDEEAEMRENIFDISTIGQTAEPQEARQARQGGKEAEESVPGVESKTWDFPSVGLLPSGEEVQVNNLAGAKFAYGLEQWLATGELLPLW